MLPLGPECLCCPDLLMVAEFTLCVISLPGLLSCGMVMNNVKCYSMKRGRERRGDGRAEMGRGGEAEKELHFCLNKNWYFHLALGILGWYTGCGPSHIKSTFIIFYYNNFWTFH